MKEASGRLREATCEADRRSLSLCVQGFAHPSQTPQPSSPLTEHTPVCPPPGHSQANLLMSGLPWVSLWELIAAQGKLEDSVQGAFSVDISTLPVYLQWRCPLEASHLQLGLDRGKPD